MLIFTSSGAKAKTGFGTKAGASRTKSSLLSACNRLKVTAAFAAFTGTLLLCSHAPAMASTLMDCQLVAAQYGQKIAAAPAKSAAPAPKTSTEKNLTSNKNSTQTKNAAKSAGPVNWQLSPEAEHMYYYLLLTEAVSEGDDLLLTKSLYGLLKLEPSRPIYQDGVTLLLARKRFAEAKELAKQGLHHYPEDETLTVLLSGAYSELQEEAEAIALLAKYVEKHPKATEAAQELTRLYFRSGQDKKAHALLDTIPQEGQSPLLLYFQSKLYATAGEYGKARKLLKNILHQNPKFAEGWVELGIISEKDDKQLEAIEYYQKAVELMPDSIDLWFRITQLQVDEKRFGDAFNTAVKAPNPTEFPLQAALLFGEARDEARAVKLVEIAKSNGAPSDEAAIFLSVIRYQITGNPLEALKPLEAVSPQSPLYQKIGQRKVQLLMQADELVRANQEAEKLRKQFPDVPDMWGLEAYSLSKLGKDEAATTLMYQALAQKPDDEDLLFALGSVQDEAGDKKAALATMEKIVTINPKNPRALNYIGFTLADENRDLDRAEKLIKQALEELPETEYIIDSLAWVYYRQGHYGLAFETIKHCLGLASEDAAVWDHYGDIAKALGKKDEAIKGYTEAIKLNPANVKDIKAKLKALK